MSKARYQPVADRDDFSVTNDVEDANDHEQLLEYGHGLL
jgi:hypothetical protein